MFECFWWYLWPKMTFKMSQKFQTVSLDITISVLLLTVLTDKTKTDSSSLFFQQFTKSDAPCTHSIDVMSLEGKKKNLPQTEKLRSTVLAFVDARNWPRIDFALVNVIVTCRDPLLELDSGVEVCLPCCSHVIHRLHPVSSGFCKGWIS